MKPVLVLLITAAILAAQYHFGLRKRKLLGAVIPVCMAALFVALSCVEQTTQYISTGLGCVLALIVVWAAGWYHSRNYQKKELDKMKLKDL